MIYVAIAIAIGAFYVFAGVVVLRAMAMEHVMDRVLVALGDTSDANDRLRVNVLTAGGVLTLASGIALVLLSPLALPLFLSNATVQGSYLLWAERALRPENDQEAQGRRQTKNAFVGYIAASAFVVWLAVQGVLRPVGTAALATDAAIVALGILAVWIVIRLPAKDTRAPTLALPKRLRLAPARFCSPLRDAETGAPVSVFALDLPETLAQRIDAWDDLWQATQCEDDTAGGGFDSEEARSAYVAEGRLIAVELGQVWAGELEVADEFR